MLNERELYAEEKWGISTVEADRHSYLSGERVLCQQELEFFRVLCSNDYDTVGVDLNKSTYSEQFWIPEKFTCRNDQTHLAICYFMIDVLFWVQPQERFKDQRLMSNYRCQ